MTGPVPKPWNLPPGLKFPCPFPNHKHEVSTFAEFFSFSPLDCWEKIEKGRMCYSCLKPRSVCKTRKCNNVAGVPEILKCAICASWAVSKELALFSVFFVNERNMEELLYQT